MVKDMVKNQSAVAQPQHARFLSGQHGIDPHSGPAVPGEGPG